MDFKSSFQHKSLESQRSSGSTHFDLRQSGAFSHIENLRINLIFESHNWSLLTATSRSTLIILRSKLLLEALESPPSPSLALLVDYGILGHHGLHWITFIVHLTFGPTLSLLFLIIIFQWMLMNKPPYMSSSVAKMKSAGKATKTSCRSKDLHSCADCCRSRPANAN